MTTDKLQNANGTELVISRVYHTIWAHSKAHQWALRDINLQTRKALLQPPKRKNGKKFWTDLDSLLPTNKYL